MKMVTTRRTSTTIRTSDHTPLSVVPSRSKDIGKVFRMLTRGLFHNVTLLSHLESLGDDAHRQPHGSINQRWLRVDRQAPAAASIAASASGAPPPVPFSKSPSTRPIRFVTCAKHTTGQRRAPAKA